MAKKIIVTAIIAIFGIVVNFSACDNGTNPGGNDPRPASPEPMSEKTAMQYFTDEGITAGWNLGNTLDAVNNWSDKNHPVAEEGCWYNIPKANQAIFNGVKERGFKIVRIPCTWTGHIGPAPDYKVSQDRLRRVAEVACYARDAGLKAIINLHHDDSEDWGGWLLLENAAANQNDQITDKFEKVWTQIAEYFKDYGDWLIFESMNEVHDEYWGWSQSFQSNPELFIDIVNKWNQSFTNAVRSTGSNNAQRFLMYPSYASNPECIISDGKVGDAEPGKYFKLPTDSADNGRQIVTFHYYDSSEFGDDNGIDIDWKGTQEQKNSINDLFGKFKTEFIDKNIPVVIGECGAVMQLYPSDPAKEQQARQSRREYLPHVFGTAKKYGMVPLYWDNGAVTGDGEKFGLFDRRNGQPNSSESELLIKMMINAVK